MEIILTAIAFVLIIRAVDKNSYKCGFADAKAKFDKEQNYSIEEICPHDVVEVKVLCTLGTCETTVEQCEECKKILTKPKIEC